MLNDRPTSGPKNGRGVTPMMVNGTRSIVTVRPSTFGSRPKRPLPIGVADDRDGPVSTTATTVVVGVDAPAHDRRDAEQLEEAATDEHALLATVRGADPHAHLLEGPGARAVELIGPQLHLFPDRVRPDVTVQHEQAIGVTHRQRTEEQVVDDREDRGIRPDAEGQRQDGRGREQRIAAEQADAHAGVAPPRLQPAEPALLAHGFLHRRHAASPLEHSPPRLVRVHPGRDLVVELERSQTFQFLAQLAIVAIATEKPGHAPRGPAQRAHASPPSARNRAMIAVVWAQSREARAISARPPRVSR